MSRTGLLVMLQQLLTMSTLCWHTCTNTTTPLISCFANYALVHVMPNVWQMLLQFVDIVYPRLIVCYLQRIFNIKWK